MSATELIAKIDDHSPFRQQVNRDLMVAWINADLVNRAWGDVRTSNVFYDGAKVFITALPRGCASPQILAKLYEVGVRYWSQGVL